MGGLPLIELLILIGGIAVLLLFARWVRARSRVIVQYSPPMTVDPAMPRPMTVGASPRFEVQENPWSRQLRLDAAVPNKVVVSKPFELIVAVRWPSSPSMQLGRQWQSRSPKFRVGWKEENPSIDLIVEVQASGCTIAGENFRVFSVYTDDDAPELNFMLTPVAAGEHIIHVTVSNLLETVGGVSFHIESQVSDREFDMEPASVMIETNGFASLYRSWEPLYYLLNRAFSVDEMRDLCLRMHIDFEELPGRTKSNKFGELMGYCQRRGQLSVLVAHVLAERPNWRGYFAAG
ncbi:protein of unknown function [Candidatus Promineifilum breve]|uniref:Effector-associated domain-containing protein n=1 Tax=Candidatus Promineifilum breve TaxID=1806508 RepID=A0A160T9K4_9CHLR|nr:hypothetical protein [Candidatus Promineifilum breve]CUS05720.1 protein of unknown function [Candidatus Promineifilum breve]